MHPMPGFPDPYSKIPGNLLPALIEKKIPDVSCRKGLLLNAGSIQPCADLSFLENMGVKIWILKFGFEKHKSCKSSLFFNIAHKIVLVMAGKRFYSEIILYQ